MTRDRSDLDLGGILVAWMDDAAPQSIPVLVLQHQFGMSHVEIAETLGVPVGTVKSRIRYGTTAMRAALEADDRNATQATGRSA